MTETSTAQLNYDRLAPVTAHDGLAAEQFAEFFKDTEGPILNVAAGHTNLHSDLLLAGRDIKVVSLDPTYRPDERPYVGGERVSGVAQALPFEDGQFATTLMHFGMQHLSSTEDAAASIREMIRVTRSVDTIHDNRAGTILIGPVFDRHLLSDVIYKNKLEDVCGIQDAPDPMHGVEAKPSLVIKKVPALTEGLTDRISLLADSIAESGALRRGRRSAAELISRYLFRGHSRV